MRWDAEQHRLQEIDAATRTVWTAMIHIYTLVSTPQTFRLFTACCVVLGASARCFGFRGECVCFMAFLSRHTSRAPSRSQTSTTDSCLSVRLFPRSVAASNLFATGANLNIIYDQTQKSGDRGCAGQTRSGVGTLIALIKFMALVERLLLNCARPKQFIGLGQPTHGRKMRETGLKNGGYRL